MITKEGQPVHHLSLLEKIPDGRKIVIQEPTEMGLIKHDKETGQYVINRKEIIERIDNFKERTKPVNILNSKGRTKGYKIGATTYHPDISFSEIIKLFKMKTCKIK